MNKNLVIVIPTYTPNWTADERFSVERVRMLCPEYDIRLVCPVGMAPVEGFESIEREEFQSTYFEGIAGYNRLMLSAEFYERFGEYEYLLIYQTDAYIFRNELADWCRRGYPYVGAPWIKKRKYHGIGRMLLYLRAIPKRIQGRPFMPLDLAGKVGNGGFSLRRVADHAAICREQQTEIQHWLNKSLTVREYNEDCFWATRPGWQYPTVEEALGFAFDLSPEEALIQNRGQLPMAAHGWNKAKYKTFWKQYIVQS